MNILSKRTFFEGCYIELFRRNDGGHRIKFVTPAGDEVTINLDSKGWAKGTPEKHFEDIAFAERPSGFDGTGSALEHNIALWHLLVNCDSYIKNVVRQLGVNLARDNPNEGVTIAKMPEINVNTGTMPKSNTLAPKLKKL